MTTDTDTLGRPIVKVPIGHFMEMAQRAKRRDHDLGVIRLSRNACWVLAGMLGTLDVLLTLLDAAGEYNTPRSVLRLMTIAVVLSFCGAMTIQVTINQRCTVAELDEIKTAVRSIDPSGIGTLAAQLEQNHLVMQQVLRAVSSLTGEIRTLREHQDDLESDVAGLIIERQKPDGRANGSRLSLRPARPEDFN